MESSTTGVFENNKSSMNLCHNVNDGSIGDRWINLPPGAIPRPHVPDLVAASERDVAVKLNLDTFKSTR
jgi:hypothetical protein